MLVSNGVLPAPSSLPPRKKNPYSDRRSYPRNSFCLSRSLRRHLWNVALHSPVSMPFELFVHECADGSSPPQQKKSQRWRAALGPTPVHARSVERDVRARSHSARARNLARLSDLCARAQFDEWFAVVHAPHERGRGRLCDHYLPRRKCVCQCYVSSKFLLCYTPAFL